MRVSNCSSCMSPCFFFVCQFSVCLSSGLFFCLLVYMSICQSIDHVSFLKQTRPDTRQDSRGQLGRGRNATRPDTRPIPVADGWAGAEMRVFPLFDSSVTDQPTNRRTDRPTDRRTDKASYRVACPRLKNAWNSEM